ncbi:MAG: methylated-DNA--[Fusobacterium sp.]|nr:methylated-DNA--[protein]-cysteine S-methyltransferase [Fusobacterium sp.]
MKAVSFLENEILGLIAVIEENYGIRSIEFLKGKKERERLLRSFKESPLTKECIKQLKEYFLGKRKKFDIKLDIVGTEFQKSAWQALLKIPYGKTISYSEQAKMIKNEKAIRAIGGANGKNNLPILIPCHRVIGKNGDLVGYSGGIDIKIYLLELEKKYSM